MSIDLESLKKLCEAATPGPWRVTTYAGGFSFKGRPHVYAGTDEEYGEPYQIPGRNNLEADVAFIAASREALPAIVARALAAEAENKRLKTQLSYTLMKTAGWLGKSYPDLRDELGLPKEEDYDD